MLEADLLWRDVNETIEQRRQSETPGQDSAWKSASQSKQILVSYLKCTPCVVFNSATYDINSIKPYLFTNLVQHEQGDIVEEEKPITPRPRVFVIEKDNVYESITTPTLKFRDVNFFSGPW